MRIQSPAPKRRTASGARTRVLRVLTLTVALLSTAEAWAGFTLFRGASDTPAGLVATRDSFRAALGGGAPLPNGSFGGVRREINWDGVPDGFSDSNLLPANFFNVNSPRGVVFSTPGTGFLVSADSSNPSGTPIRFGFPNDFVPFSNERMFTSIGSNVFDIDFFLAGTNSPGFVSAFGAVFNDVEFRDTTKMEAFGADGSLLLSEFVDTTVSGGLSFLGFKATAGEEITKVRLTLGTSPLLSNGVFGEPVNGDGVVVDDFLYTEVRLVPEPGSLALALVGLAGVLAIRARARRS